MFHVEEQGRDGTYRPLTAFETEEEARAFIAKHAIYSGNGTRLVEVETRSRWIVQMFLSGKWQDERFLAWDDEEEARAWAAKNPNHRVGMRTVTTRFVLETFEPTVAADCCISSMVGLWWTYQHAPSTGGTP